MTGKRSAPEQTVAKLRRVEVLTAHPRLRHFCSALFLPPGADGFASRQVHGLRYRPESERAARRARRLRAKLGEHRAALGGTLLDKPLRMRRPTYS